MSEIWYNVFVCAFYKTVSVVLLFKKKTELISKYCCLMFIFKLTGPMFFLFLGGGGFNLL